MWLQRAADGILRQSAVPVATAATQGGGGFFPPKYGCAWLGFKGASDVFSPSTTR
jgi:hypothetical protein